MRSLNVSSTASAFLILDPSLSVITSYCDIVPARKLPETNKVCILSNLGLLEHGIEEGLSSKAEEA